MFLFFKPEKRDENTAKKITPENRQFVVQEWNKTNRELFKKFK